MPYILAIDQSTSSTKAMIFGENANLVARADVPHKQLVDERGWVEHDPLEIWSNLLRAVKDVIAQTGIDAHDICGVGLSNQRETAIVWDKVSGKPLHNAIVWQCDRGKNICNRIEKDGESDYVKQATGINLSPYFSAAKIAWVLENIPAAQKAMVDERLCCSTMDSWLVYMLTNGETIQTDYSNASRSQLFNINNLHWDSKICSLFNIPIQSLPEVANSNSLFGFTDFDGLLSKPIPIHSVMGDSHSALYGQGCLRPGMIKTTYGTGSSVMMNIGNKPIFGKSIATSLAWGIDNQIDYVLEGNINYTGAVTKWLVDDIMLLSSAREAGKLASLANPNSNVYLVPAFSGLGAPYWNDEARAMICGMDRSTGKAEIVRAAEECIAYQITDILRIMRNETAMKIDTLKVDGGPTNDHFLMQFQADIAGVNVLVAPVEELSGMGVAIMSGISLGIYDANEVFDKQPRNTYHVKMNDNEREIRYNGWLAAVQQALKTN